MRCYLGLRFAFKILCKASGARPSGENSVARVWGVVGLGEQGVDFLDVGGGISRALHRPDEVFVGAPEGFCIRLGLGLMKLNPEPFGLQQSQLRQLLFHYSVAHVIHHDYSCRRHMKQI